MSNITLRILIGSLLFLSLTGLTQEQSGYQDFILLSDLDDTLKITNHSGGVSRLYRALWSTKVFAGMERLYQQISDDSSDFYIVSASPKLIRSRVKRLLRKRGLNHAKVVLKKIRDGKTYNYKVGAIKHILSQTTGRLILVGDDTSHDPEVYDYIMQNYPDRVETIYIRTIVGRELPSSATPIWSAYDIAIAEHQAGRLTLEKAASVGSKIIQTKKSKLVHPKFVICPDQFIPLAVAEQEDLRTMQEAIYQRHQRICDNR